MNRRTYFHDVGQRGTCELFVQVPLEDPSLLSLPVRHPRVAVDLVLFARQSALNPDEVLEKDAQPGIARLRIRSEQDDAARHCRIEADHPDEFRLFTCISIEVPELPHGFAVRFLDRAGLFRRQPFAPQARSAVGEEHGVPRGAQLKAVPHFLHLQRFE